MQSYESIITIKARISVEKFAYVLKRLRNIDNNTKNRGASTIVYITDILI